CSASGSGNTAACIHESTPMLLCRGFFYLSGMLFYDGSDVVHHIESRHPAEFLSRLCYVVHRLCATGIAINDLDSAAESFGDLENRIASGCAQGITIAIPLLSGEKNPTGEILDICESAPLCTRRNHGQGFA